MPPQTAEPLELFYSYAHKDEELRDELEKHLVVLKRDGVIREWHDRQILAGQEWDKQIDAHLDSADIILLLVSPDFLASDYCFDIEVKRAMERHESGEARVIPVILRKSGWANAPFSKLQALPKNAKPVKRWRDRDEAFDDVAQGIRRAAEELRASPQTQPSATPAPADSPKAPPPVNLPRPPAVGFVSRRDEQGRDILERLREELSPERGGLVALWGPGGSGKTTLAAEAVRALAPLFGERLAWVSALGRPDFSLQTLLDDIATRLGRDDLRRKPPAEKQELVRALVSASPALVVLDNFETIRPEGRAACAEFLASCGQCPALITTRVRVSRDEVANIRLAAMEPDEAREFLRLLVRGSGKPSAFDCLDHDQLIGNCEANPLVMQWVVSQVVLARRPQDALDEIKRGEGDAAERVFTRSFDLLGGDARDVLLALPLFTPDASRAALAYVAGFGEDLRRLERAAAALSALGLVETTAGNERLLLRGLTRQLAKSRLNLDLFVVVYRQRFVEYFLRYARKHRHETAEDFDALEREKDNLFGALDVAFGWKDWASVVRINEALSHFLDLRGYWAEAINIGELALRAARATRDEPTVARLSHSLAVTYHNRGEFAEARRLYTESLEIMRRLGDERNVAIALHQLGWLAQEAGQEEEARRLSTESLEISKRLGNQRAVSATLHQLGMHAHVAGQTNEARRLYTESLEISTRLGLQRGIANTLQQLGKLALNAGDIDAARRFYTEALNICKQLGDAHGLSNVLLDLGVIAANAGERQEARRLYTESLEVKKRLGDQGDVALALNNLGMIAANEGDRGEAARLVREALSIWERIGSPDAKIARGNLARLEGASREEGG